MVTDCHEVPDAAAGRRCHHRRRAAQRHAAVSSPLLLLLPYVSCARVKDLYQVKETLKKLCEFLNVCADPTIFLAILKISAIFLKHPNFEGVFFLFSWVK